MINIPYPEKDVLVDFYNSQKDEILKRIKVIKNGKSISYKKKKYKVTKHCNYVLSWLEKEKNLRLVLLAKPRTLKKIIKKVENNKNFQKAKYTKEALNRILYRIFVDHGYVNIDKLKFVKTINLGSCPYCNRNYIFSVNKKGSVKPEIDHFYPKTLYPYLACSYFNLIPSCPTCNGFGAKESKDTYGEFKILNPYNVKAEDFRFSIKPIKIDFLDAKNTKRDFYGFKVEIYGNKSNIELFKLKELYAQHKDIVWELLIKKTHYPESYIKELSSFGFGEDEIYRFLFCNYNKEEDLHKRPLSKLTKDILQELGLTSVITR